MGSSGASGGAGGVGDPSMGGDMSGTASNAQIVANAVGAAEVADGTIGTAEVANDSLTANDLASGSVTSSEIGANQVQASEIDVDAVGSSEIAADAVGSSELAAGSITAADAAADMATEAEIDLIESCITYSVTDAAGAVTLATGTGANRWYNRGVATITAVRATVGTAPTGASILIDVNKNGTTLFTTQSNRPTIAASTTTDLADAVEVTSLADGDYLTVDIDQVGSTEPGKDLIVQIWLRRS